MDMNLFEKKVNHIVKSHLKKYGYLLDGEIIKFEDTINLATKCLLDNNIESIGNLDKNQVFILRERLGINPDMKPKSCEEIGNLVGLSGSRVSGRYILAFRQLVKRIKLVSGQELLRSDLEFSEETQKLIFANSKIQHFSDFLNIAPDEKEYEEIRIKMQPFVKDRDIPSSVSIDTLELSSRAFNALTKAGIKNIEDLTSKTSEEIKKIRNLGQSSFDEILDKFHSMGYQFKNEREDFSESIMINDDTQISELEKLGVNTRTINALTKSGKRTLRDILMLSQSELQNIRNLGSKSYNEILEKMHSMGYRFKDELHGESLTTTAQTEETNLQIVIERRNELLTKGKQLTEERDTLLQQERELDSRIASAVQNKGNIQNGVQNGTTKK